MKLNVGCGKKYIQGWVNIDRSGARKTDLQHDVRKPFPYTDESIEKIYCSHLLEHLTDIEGRFLLREFYRLLMPGGYLRLVVPDFDIAYNDFETGKEIKYDGVALEGKTRGKRLLCFIVRYRSGEYVGPPLIKDVDIAKNFDIMSKNEFIEWVKGLLPDGVIPDHQNAYHEKKIREFLRGAGFNFVFKTQHMHSRYDNEFTMSDFSTRPEISLYIEAKK